MTLPEGRKPLLWSDMEFAQPIKRDQFNCLSGHPSTWEQEVEQLRAHIKAALDCLEASKFANAEHQGKGCSSQGYRVTRKVSGRCRGGRT